MTKQEMLKHIEDEMVLCAGDHSMVEGMLNIECVDCDPDKRTADYIYRPNKWEFNDYGGVHGGMIATACDYAICLAIGAVIDAYAGTASLTINYIKPMFADKYRLHCTCLHPGNKISHGLVEVFDSDTGVLVATCTGTFARVNMDISK